MRTERNKKFLAQYFHDGSWWSVDIYAIDFADAEAICKKLNLQLDGEHIMTIPACAGAGIFVKTICAIRNFFWRSSSVILALALCSCTFDYHLAQNGKKMEKNINLGVGHTVHRVGADGSTLTVDNREVAGQAVGAVAGGWSPVAKATANWAGKIRFKKATDPQAIPGAVKGQALLKSTVDPQAVPGAALGEALLKGTKAQ